MPAVQPIIIQSQTVVASPAANAETTIAQITLPSTADAGSNVDLSGWARFTVGTGGTAVRFRIRSGSITGTVEGDTGALTGGVAAGNLLAQDVEGFDNPGEVAGLLYVLTMTVTGGAAPSTVAGVKLRAIVYG